MKGFNQRCADVNTVKYCFKEVMSNESREYQQRKSRHYSIRPKKYTPTEESSTQQRLAEELTD
jgi:hypothetical protein